MYLRFPYAIDGRGRTAEAHHAEWVRGLIEQVLFTSPGERVMRPDFGSGVTQLVFAPNSIELAAATRTLVQGALQHWLANVILVEDVTVDAIDAALTVTVTYTILRTGARATETFRNGGAP
jgi:phage baseplate assembly protein W